MRTPGMAMLVVVGLTLAGSPGARAETPAGGKAAGAERGQAPAPENPKGASELRVGLLILRDLLHPQDAPAGAEAQPHRSYLVQAARQWPKEFPAKAGKRTMKVEVVEVGKAPPKLRGYDLLVLMPCWAYYATATAALDAHAGVFHEYVKQGGGLLVFQPNPMDDYPQGIGGDFAPQGFKRSGISAPQLLPLSATFYNWYHNADGAKRTETRHPITEGLEDSQMPFPADQVADLAREYAVLARGTKSGAPSLAAGTFGKGRVVLIMSNVDGETISRQERRSDVVPRAILWAGGCGEKEVMAVGGR